MSTERLKLTRPRLAAAHGLPVRVGKSTFVVPSGSQVVHPAGSRNLAYVLGFDQVPRAFIPHGEIELTPELQGIIRRRYFQPGNKNFRSR